METLHSPVTKLIIGRRYYTHFGPSVKDNIEDKQDSMPQAQVVCR